MVGKWRIEDNGAETMVHEERKMGVGEVDTDRGTGDMEVRRRKKVEVRVVGERNEEFRRKGKAQEKAWRVTDALYAPSTISQTLMTTVMD